MTIALALLFGVAIGTALGLFGGGGSILAVPALVYGLGQPMAQAVPASLVVVGVSAAAGILPRRRRHEVRWPVAGVFGGAGTAATFAGAAVGRLLPDRALLLTFAALMVVVGARMLTGTTGGGGVCAMPHGRVDWRSCLPKALGIGLLVGFLTGLLGVGGGFIVVPALTLLLGLDMPTAVGTSLVILVINSAGGFVAHLGEARLGAVALIFAASALVTAIAMGRVGTGLPEAWLRRGFAVLVLAVAAFVAVRTLL